ncbi:hypothetical protein N0B44_00850 [Roseibacterium beibuensis]|uniref:Uncharacterized protein n=1 Tax=[Roseibacterium] beibuensis TaxID=1193142 RepID=A0ABP9L4A9_9RHOB|nr:hypothetical protein [Roseibacterium beibuensis]MCS6621449.1 hypothetical protein [Roseibacterium beibuensis]
MKPVALPFALALCAATAQAEPWDCELTVSCGIGAACEATALRLALLPADHAGDLFVTGLGADIPVARLSAGPSAPRHYAGHGGEIALLLTIEADTRTRLTLHGGDERGAATSYFGTCEELT